MCAIKWLILLLSCLKHEIRCHGDGFYVQHRNIKVFVAVCQVTSFVECGTNAFRFLCICVAVSVSLLSFCQDDHLKWHLHCSIFKPYKYLIFDRESICGSQQQWQVAVLATCIRCDFASIFFFLYRQKAICSCVCTAQSSYIYRMILDSWYAFVVLMQVEIRMASTPYQIFFFFSFSFHPDESH